MPQQNFADIFGQSLQSTGSQLAPTIGLIQQEKRQGLMDELNRALSINNYQRQVANDKYNRRRDARLDAFNREKFDYNKSVTERDLARQLMDAITRDRNSKNNASGKAPKFGVGDVIGKLGSYDTVDKRTAEKKKDYLDQYSKSPNYEMIPGGDGELIPRQLPAPPYEVPGLDQLRNRSDSSAYLQSQLYKFGEDPQNAGRGQSLVEGIMSAFPNTWGRFLQPGNNKQPAKPRTSKSGVNYSTSSEQISDWQIDDIASSVYSDYGSWSDEDKRLMRLHYRKTGRVTQ